MGLPNWWEVVTPRKDILAGKLSEAVFAADLGDVVKGKAPLEYQDSRTFFHKTYLTNGMRHLLETVLARLAGDESRDAYIQLATPFGGGKTHSLMALYHLARELGKEDKEAVLKELGLPVSLLPQGVFPKPSIAVFVGTHADALRGRTPWGEIAHQFGIYEVIEEHDRKRIAPGKEKLREVIETAAPCLILMDELLEYVVKANRVEKLEKITQGQTLAFLQEITEVVANTPGAALVLTLPASHLEQYDEEAEKTLVQIQKVSGRVESIYTPVEGMEIYEIVRKRLFDDLGDPTIHKEVAQSYFQFYSSLGEDVPAEVRDLGYREKIERAYPFHPELIDVLYERWGSFPTFQRTRGVLRLLAMVVADLYARKVSTPLIQSSLVNLAHRDIRREFIKHIGNEFDSVISSDIVDTGQAKAIKLDERAGSEYKKYGIAQGTATAIFLYSFSGGERRGVALPRLRVAVLRESIHTALVGDVVNKLEEELWYFHSEGGLYRFTNQPNLNRVIMDRMESVAPDKIEAELKEILQKVAGKEMEVYLWPESPADVPDNKRIKLAVLHPSSRIEDNEVEDLFFYGGQAFRIYKNTLLGVGVEPGNYPALEKTIVKYIATKEVLEDKELMGGLTRDAVDELQDRFKALARDLPSNVIGAYRWMGMAGDSSVIWKDMGMLSSGASRSIAARVRSYLMDQGLLLPAMDPGVIMRKALGDEEMERNVDDIYALFLKTPGLPVPEKEEVVVEAVRRGVEKGVMGLKLDSKVYFRSSTKSLPSEVISREGVVLRPERAEELLEAERREEIGEKAPSPPVPEPPGGVGDAERDYVVPAERAVRQLSFKFKVPWDKLSSVISGVVGPLKAQGADTEIIIQVRAKSDKGIDKTVLSTKVKETLDQIGAESLEWKEE